MSKIPYQDELTAKNAVWDYNAREKSSYFELLTGSGKNWELTVVQNQEEANKFMSKENGFMTKSFVKKQEDGWKDVELPKSWTSFGFDFSIYTNVQMPWQTKYDANVKVPNAPTVYNPVGLYRKTFKVDPSYVKDGRRVYLSFEGVESAYYVYINGKEVGYSEDSYSPHRFDITDYLNKPGEENLLAVKVHKFCDGTWFEDQDMIYDGGIFRDVYLVSEPLVKINDYTVKTYLKDNYKNAILDLSIDIENISKAVHSGFQLEVKAFDKDGVNILENKKILIPDVNSGETKTVLHSEKVINPKLWTADNPNLYALVITLYDGLGNQVETLSTQLGFREVEFTRTEVDENGNVTTKEWQPVKINGKRLLFKGTNRHDSDPFNGKAVTQEVMKEDVTLMKQNNLNAIRTSHYSNDDYLYWLCNKYGLYMMAETNLESHAIAGWDKEQSWFYNLGMDRTKTTFERLKNNPAIVSWSIGNEMGYNRNKNSAGGLFYDMVWFFKDNDSTRLVHSEGLDTALGTDMGSNMYASVDATQNRTGKGRIPYVLC